MGFKERKRWEAFQRSATAVAGCKSCGRWGDSPDGVEVEPGVPVACRLITTDEIQQYETWSNLPDFRTFAHKLHMEFSPDTPCGVDCAPPKTRYSSGIGGMSIFQRIKAAVKIEDIASTLTNLTGNKTLTGPCPFHGGTGKELVIWTDIEEWKCYGRCQTGGDVIHFIQECKKEGLEWAVPRNLPKQER